MKISLIHSSASDVINSSLKPEKISRNLSKIFSVSAVMTVVLSFITAEPARALPFLQNATAQGEFDVTIRSTGPLGGGPLSIRGSAATNEYATNAGNNNSGLIQQSASNIFQIGGGLTGATSSNQPPVASANIISQTSGNRPANASNTAVLHASFDGSAENSNFNLSSTLKPGTAAQSYSLATASATLAGGTSYDLTANLSALHSNLPLLSTRHQGAGPGGSNSGWERAGFTFTETISLASDPYVNAYVFVRASCYNGVCQQDVGMSNNSGGAVQFAETPAQILSALQGIVTTPLFGDPRGIDWGAVFGTAQSLDLFSAYLSSSQDFNVGIRVLSFTEVPEPGSLALMGLGIAVLGFFCRDRKAAT